MKFATTLLATVLFLALCLSPLPSERLTLVPASVAAAHQTTPPLFAKTNPKPSTINPTVSPRLIIPYTLEAMQRSSFPGFLPFFVPNITATKTDAIFTDNGSPGATPGDVIEYTVVISNAGGAMDATGVVFSDQIDVNTTLVPGSLNASPIGVNDTYTSIGNVGITVPVGNGLLLNDIEPDGTGGLTVTAFDATSTNGGTVNVAANGSFTYLPTPGFEGTDNFNYTVNDGEGATDVGTVTITVNEVIWFIDNNAANGDGRLGTPFNSIANFNSTAVDEVDDIIFLYRNTATNYTGPLTLLDGQDLIGAGAASSIVTISGITLPPHSNALPATGGTNPVIAHNNTNLTLAQNNKLHGFNLSNSGGTALTGNGLGTLQVRNVSINNTAGTAVNLNNGVLDVIFPSVSSSNAANGISVSNTTGSLQITGTGTTDGSGGTISNISQRGINLSNVTNMSLNNMTLTNMTGDAGGAGVCDATTSVGCFGAVYLNNVTTISLTNVDVSTTQEQGIVGNEVSGLTITNSTVTQIGSGIAGGDPNECAVYLRDLKGTCSITNSNFTFADTRPFHLINSSETLNLTIDNCDFTDTKTPGQGEDALEMQFLNACNTTLNITNSEFRRYRTYGIQIQTLNTSTTTATITSNQVLQNVGVAGNGIELSGSGTSTVNYNVNNNAVNYRNGNGIGILTIGNANSSGKIIGNTITGPGADITGIGIRVAAEDDSDGVNLIQNNTLNNVGFNIGILAFATQVDPSSAGNATLNTTIDNNNVNTVANTSGTPIAIEVRAGSGVAGETPVVCANVKNNDVVIAGTFFAFRPRTSTIGAVLNLAEAMGTATVANYWTTKGNTPPGGPFSTGQVGTLNFVAGTCTAPPLMDDPVVMLTTPNPTNKPQETVQTNITETAPPATKSAKGDNQGTQKSLLAGETVRVDGTADPNDVGAGFNLPAGESTTIKFRVTINSPLPLGTCQISNQGTVTATGGINILTDDPSLGGVADPTITPLAPMSLGNQVFRDNNKNNLFDGGDVGINGVSINLYNDANDDNVPDGGIVATTTTAGGGLYSFPTLCSGNYIVEIPASEFGAGQELNGLISSPLGAAPDPDNDVNNDDNGEDGGSGTIRSKAITLNYSVGMVEVNNTLDFGFKSPTTVTINDPVVMEGNVAGDNRVLTFTVTRSDIFETFNLDVAITGGTATGGGTDYINPAQTTVSFTANGSLTATFAVEINEETLVEGDETVQVTLSNAPGEVILTDAVGTGIIQNDDQAVISIAATTQAAEDATNGLFTISTTNQFDAAVTVNFTVSGTATSGTDYTSLGTSVNFPANTSSITLPVSVLPDAIVEATETVIVTITSISPVNPSITIAASPNNAATVNITDNDVATIAISNVSMLEGDAGTTNFVFNVTLTGVLDGQVSVDFATADGSATIANTDYQTNNGTLNFLANTASPQTLTVTILVNGDVTGEPNENFFVNLTNLQAGGRNVTISDAQGEGTIQDDDLSFSIGDAVIVEGNAGTTNLIFTVTRTSTTTAESINYQTADNTATDADNDYEPENGTLNFAIGDDAEEITITINGDLNVEANETFFVNLTNQSNGSIADAQATGTITNDDFATLTLAGGTTKDEGNAGTTTYTFTVTLDKNVPGGLTVPFTVNDGTATDADDFNVITANPLTFTGTANEEQTITVEVTGDTKVELNETFSVTLGTVSGTLASAVNVSGSPQEATITNDDAAVVSIAANVSQNENITPQTFTVTLSNPVDANVTVLFNTSNGTATTADNDYDGITNQIVTFLAGSTTNQTVDVTINNDNIVEANELYNVAISGLNASGRNVTLSANNSSATGTITNDDAATVTLAPVNASQPEGNTGTTNFTFSATLNNPVQGGFTLPFTVTDGTATDADDFDVVTTSPLAFNGTANEQIIITVQVNGDFKVEANETFTVALGAISGAPTGVTTAGSPQGGTIQNDEVDFGDAPDTYGTLLAISGARHNTVLGFQLGATIDGDANGQPNANGTGDDTDAEGDDDDGVTLPAALITGLNAAVTVNASQAGRLDAWVDFNGNGSFADAGEKIFNNVVLVAGDNNLSFAVPMGATVGTTFTRFRLSSAGGLPFNGAATDGEVEDYEVQILNNQYSINSPSVAEGNAGTTDLTFTVSRTATNLAGSVDYAITGGTATSGDDYQPLAAGTINFAANGNNSENIIVKVNGDLIVEPNETIIITLSNAVGGGIGTGIGTGTITNDDAAVVSLTLLDATKNEGTGGGTTNFTFAATLNNPVQDGFDLAFTVTDGTATDADDYNVITTSPLSFTGTANEQQIITVAVLADAKVEADETFDVTIEDTGFSNTTAPAGTLTTASTVTATILNDDAATLSIDDVSTQEGINGTQIYTFTVTLNAEVQGGVAVNYTTANNTATAGSDYVATNGTLNFTGTIGETETIQVTVNGDCIEEADETFFVNLSNIVASVEPGSITFADNQGLGTILNDDASYPSGIIYVDANAVGTNNGTSWANAFTNLQDALRVACTCGVGQIWVADGTYYPDQGVAQTNDDRTSTFQLCNNVAVYGGFAGGETLLSERDIFTNIAILSGDLTQNDGANFTNNADNAYHVVTGSGTDMTARIDGFTITRGNADDAGTDGNAGGMLNVTGSPTVANCTFSGNRGAVGGAMFNLTNSAPIITNCTFSGNLTPSTGGGIFNEGSSPSITNCIFSGNQATIGGGMFSIGGTSAPSIINSTFSGNRATVEGGAIYNSGGTTLQLINTIIWNNQDQTGTGTASSSLVNDFSTSSITYSLIQGQNPAGTGNKNGTLAANDPDFVNPISPASAPTTAGDYRLQISSPVINMGNDAAVPADTKDVDDDGDITEATPDLDLNNRLVGGTAPSQVDLGAYEFPCAAEAGLLANSLASNNLTICAGTDPGFTFDAQGEAIDATYLYAFLLVNSGGTIVQFNSNGDFDLTTLAAGAYTVYGLSYANFNTPNTIAAYLAGKTIAQIQTDDAGTAFCLDLTGTAVNGQTNVINVNGVTAGSIAADQTICSGDDPTAFTSTTAGSGSGTITYRWESNTTGCDSTFTAIQGATGATYDPGVLTQTTYFRRVTISTLNGVACEAISNCLTVTVNQITPGEIGGTQTVCITKDPAPFTSVTAATGSGTITYQWESSTTSCDSGFTPIDGATSATFDAAKGQFKVTTYFRRRAISTLNGVACDEVSNCITLTVLNVDCGQFPWNGN